MIQNGSFIFKRKQTTCQCRWLDDRTLVVDIGDGEFIDADGDHFFIHCEYHIDTDETIFEVWWGGDHMEADENYVTAQERDEIKQFMKEVGNYMRNVEQDEIEL